MLEEWVTKPTSVLPPDKDGDVLWKVYGLRHQTCTRTCALCHASCECTSYTEGRRRRRHQAHLTNCYSTLAHAMSSSTWVRSQTCLTFVASPTRVDSMRRVALSLMVSRSSIKER